MLQVIVFAEFKRHIHNTTGTTLAWLCKVTQMLTPHTPNYAPYMRCRHGSVDFLCRTSSEHIHGHVTCRMWPEFCNCQRIPMLQPAVHKQPSVCRLGDVWLAGTFCRAPRAMRQPKSSRKSVCAPNLHYIDCRRSSCSTHTCMHRLSQCCATSHK
jgi:hypothetical protein